MTLASDVEMLARCVRATPIHFDRLPIQLGITKMGIPAATETDFAQFAFAVPAVIQAMSLIYNRD